jgi:cysteine desulfurase / selenocysteine lyase
MNISKIREDFPILSRKVDGKDFIYFDSACTTLKPKAMIDAVLAYYSEYTGCAGRSVHKFATKTNSEFENARKKVAKFVNAKKPEEIVWTKNTTEAVNMVAHGLDFRKGDKVLTTNLEHTSGMLPWLVKQKAGKIDLDFVLCNQEGEFNIESFKDKIDGKTKLVSVIYASNVTATRLPMKEIIDIAHDRGALVFVDAAQAAPHFPIDVRKLDIDFMGVSGHKMCGPTGIGFLYGKLDLLRKLSPLVTGGETIRDMDACTGCFDFEDVPLKFEAGIQHYAGAIGFGAAVDYLSSIGMKNIESHEKELTKDLTDGLLKIGVELLGPKDYGKRGALAAFNVKGMDPHDVAIMLDEQNIFVRSGMHCAYPIHKFLHKPKGSVRASLYFYNTKEEVKTFMEKLGIIMKNFGR